LTEAEKAKLEAQKKPKTIDGLKLYPINITFSAQTSSARTQAMIEQKLVFL
jgi:dihydroorotase